MEANKKYQIIIKDLEEGAEKLNVETDAIFAAVNNSGKGIGITCATSCNGNTLTNLFISAQKGIMEQITKLPHEMQILITTILAVELGAKNTTEKKSKKRDKPLQV